MPDVHPSRAAADLRVAYFISSYASGEQLLRLIRTIRRAEPDSPIVVHHDEWDRAPLDRTLFDGLDVRLLIGTEAIGWGDMGLESARWRVFRWILAELDVDWVMLLSEQDYPIAPFTAFRERLVASGSHAIISARRADDIEDPAGRRDAHDRYYYEYRFLAEAGSRVPGPLKPAARLARRVLIGVLRRSYVLNAYHGVPAFGMRDRIGVRRRRVFSRTFPCWVNECWFPISRVGMQAVVDHVDAHPELVAHYRSTVIPLESATATILFNDPALRIENAHLHAIRWSDPGSGRPDVITIEDLPDLDASGAYFTRKVDPRSVDLLDALDRRIFADAQEAA